MLLIWPLRRKCSKILIEIHMFSLKKWNWICRLQNVSHFVSAKPQQNSNHVYTSCGTLWVKTGPMYYLSVHYSGVTWVPWHLKSPATQVFFHPLVEHKNKRDIRVHPHCQPFVRGIHQWLTSVFPSKRVSNPKSRPTSSHHHDCDSRLY